MLKSQKDKAESRDTHNRGGDIRSSNEASVMEVERRAEQFKSQMDLRKYASILDEEGSSEDVTE